MQVAKCTETESRMVLSRAEVGRKGNFDLMGTVSAEENENVLEMDGDDGHTTSECA